MSFVHTLKTSCLSVARVSNVSWHFFVIAATSFADVETFICNRRFNGHIRTSAHLSSHLPHGTLQLKMWVPYLPERL